MRITLFDWAPGGHHPVYLRRFAEALRSSADVVVAAPDETLDQLGDLALETVPLGDARRPIAPTHRLGSDRTSITRREVELFEHVVPASRPDHLVHLYADAVLPHLLRRPTLESTVSVLLFYPRAHYPAAFGTRLSLGERARAYAKEAVVAAWRRRRDAHALMTLDEEAARRWLRGRGAAAYWIPEPPVVEVALGETHARSGCIVYGALAERKGIDLLARAVALHPTSLHVTIAGQARHGFEEQLDKHVAAMRAAGAEVDVHARRHSEVEGLRALSSSRCAVLPYPAHDGMSRVLLEAASVGTPVVVHNRGLLGYLVRRYALGLAVDCRDPDALRGALVELTAEADAAESYRDALARFTSRFASERFERAVTEPFAAARESRSTQGPTPAERIVQEHS